MNFVRQILILFSIILLLTAIPVTAQKHHYEDPNKARTTVKKAKAAVDIADKYFNNDEFFLAAQEYQKAVAEDGDYIYALYKLAESYRLYFNYERAQKYYKSVLEKSPDTYPLASYWYAVMLKNTGEYEEALSNFESFIKNYPPGDPNAEVLKNKAKLDAEGCRLAINEMKKPLRNYEFYVLPAPVNTGNSEYAPAIYKNDTNIVLSSGRKGTVGGKENTVLGGNTTDNLRFLKNADNSWSEQNDQDGFSVVNSEFDENTGSFTADKKKFYFTRCDEKIKEQGFNTFECVIYVTKFVNGKWSKPERLNDNINMKGEWNAQPSVSPNGDSLFFVSKRPGGKGMNDIYLSTCKGDDNWSPAKNLTSVNTPYVDMSPCYYSKEKTLFFSSNGREGFGGLDIFKATGLTFDSVTNLGLPFNSNMDDFYFVMGEEKGYLSSNRHGGMGNDDIYVFNIISREAIIAEVKKDSLLAQIARDSAKAVANGLAPDTVKSISIVGQVLYDDSKEPAADVENRLKDKDGRVVKTTKTNQEGNFRFDNLPIDDYKVEIEDKNPRLTGHAQYVVEDVQVKKSGKEVSKVLFENIYFNFDKYFLRREAKKVLKELVQYYKQHPEIQIEMNANTDSYGSSEYNKALSAKRGKAAVDYLIEKGVDPAAIVVYALGESTPIATNSNPVGRQLNRRVEFYILGGKGYQAKAMTYIADPNASLADIARKFNMTVEELKEMNGIEGEELEAYQPLRVRRTGDADIIAPVTLALVKTVAGTSENTDPRFALHEADPERYRQNQYLKPGQDYYIVAPRNTLFSIARLFGMSVDELRSLNKISSDTIYIGDRLVVKTLSAEQVKEDWKYVVKEGDSMASIAKQFGLTPKELMEMNGLSGYKLYQHMILKVK